MRDRLIELIQNAVKGCSKHWAEVIADHLLANGVTVRNEWISVEERLPEIGDVVLAVYKNSLFKNASQYIKMLRREKSYWMDSENYRLFRGNITHWMPLPEPPKERDHKCPTTPTI